MISSFSPALIGGFQGNQGGNRPDPSQMFDKLDTDKSGSLTASELEGSRFGARLQDAFADIDADGDTALTSEELQTFRAENGPPPPPPGGGQGRSGGSADVVSLFQNLMATLEAGEESSSEYTTNVLSAAENLYAEVRGIWAS